MGPTKEELANYFKNNRKYFDELAHLYRQTDPDYYNKYIAPFYGTPFTSMSSRKSARPTIAVLAATMSVFIMGIVLFFMVNQYHSEPGINEEDIDNEVESDNIESLDSLDNIKELGDYEKGVMYFQLGEYDKAEKYLEKVSERNLNYKDARLKLNEIRKRKTEKK